MSKKEKETEKEKPAQKQSEKFAFSENLKRSERNRFNIDGKKYLVDFKRDYEGKRISQFASLYNEQGEIIEPQVFHFEDLSINEQWVLARAGAITMTAEQKENFKAEKFKK